jgi:hypothetical protein
VKKWQNGRKDWIAGIEEDLQIMGVRQWRKQCEEWKKRLDCRN